MSVAAQFDHPRQEILDRYQGRIDRGDRTKLSREERENLARILVDRLVELNRQGKDDQAAIQEICEAEKALLERGYPKGSINSVYLPNYTRLLKAAIVQGRLGYLLLLGRHLADYTIGIYPFSTHLIC